MKRKSIPRIITNRQLNFTLSPVDTYNKKEMPYRLQNYCIGGTWNQHQSIILDCILDRYFRVMYSQYKTTPRSWRSKYAIEVVSNYGTAAIDPYSLSAFEKSKYDGYIEYKNEDIMKELKNEYFNNVEYFASKGITNFKQFLNTYYLGKLNDYKKYCKNMSNIWQLLNSDVPITVSKKNLNENYPVLSRYRYTLNDQLLKIASTKFRMNYKVKSVVSG